ncbi:glutamine-hydrolyzing carbamoyl-phosphate synthase small subunit [Natronospira bacteriovora]|uniref:Carbamoyl phosphate synthase small chain n=1 Tax=Natronospira bacteriovora TaxID=3069753 RepID=A0ABU0W592_9GAMM|nr:glutamine-hydrolyzing carbamoyl-phosphate synthase small subunit [Natronospira sp. AB-CW4]MDQ2069119.1 glutamine-hydrolyzing carbamoyl-phosphate synthase small subunit [Natronospira sp. AB-CW4]
MRKQALLALADGTVFHGETVGAGGTTVGEVVFNTAMTGYQEILTDPSYARQLVTLTYPHIGNVGANDQDQESDRVQAAGLIIRDLPLRASSWRSSQSLGDYLASEGTVAIAGIDTRKLTRLIRDQGAQAGCISTEMDAEAAVAEARKFPGLKGMDLAREVTARQAYEWTEGSWQLEGNQFREAPEARFHVVAYDFGVKRNILRLLVDAGCRVTVVPAQTPVDEVLAMAPDGVFLSNGPGDPEPCDYAINATRRLLEERLPLFGICLGHQLLGLAGGARSVKMKFGHHGANHPVIDLDSGQVLITSQNHGFAIDEDSLPETLRATHRSLFDKTLQGIEHREAPAFSFQGHPEASPGPHDAKPLFERFTALMAERQRDRASA